MAFLVPFVQTHSNKGIWPKPTSRSLCCLFFFHYQQGKHFSIPSNAHTAVVFVTSKRRWVVICESYTPPLTHYFRCFPSNCKKWLIVDCILVWNQTANRLLQMFYVTHSYISTALITGGLYFYVSSIYHRLHVFYWLMLCWESDHYLCIFTLWCAQTPTAVTAYCTVINNYPVAVISHAPAAVYKLL